MNKLEDRLRAELPELADVLVGGVVSEPASGTGVHRPNRRWSAVAIAAAAVLIGVLLAFGAFRSDVDSSPVATIGLPTGDATGTWRVIAESPIAPRSFATTAWDGSEVLVWAGSSANGTTAFIDAAAYDPTADGWRELANPGWGHPGLRGAFHQGTVFATAKGGFSRIDLESGTSTGLSHPSGILLDDLVSTGDELWGVGLTSGPGSELVMGRYDVEADGWDLGRGVPDDAPPPTSLGARRELLWTGTELVFWSRMLASPAYDPVGEAWRTLPELVPPSGMLVDSEAAVTDAGLVVVAEVLDGESTTLLAARLGPDGWVWTSAPFAAGSLGKTALVGAGEWAALLSAESSVVAINAGSGAVVVYDEITGDGSTVPNGVWTGTELVVFGGIDAAWTPPNP